MVQHGTGTTLSPSGPETSCGVFSPEHTVVIHNPVSGRLTSRRQATRLASELQSRGFPIYRTGRPGDGTEIAARCAREGARAVIVVGGDGTILETLQRLPPAVALATFPAGTVNLLARGLPVPRRVRPWLALLEQATTRQVYFGMCEATVFASVASAGFDAETVRQVSPSLKRWLTEGAYALKALQLYAHYRPPKYEVVVDGERCEEPILGVLIGLGPYFGGRRRVFPKAELGAPRLDVILLTGRHKRLLWAYAWGMVTGRLAKLPGAIYRQARHLQIASNPPAAVELDGDYFGHSPVTVQVQPQPRAVLALQDSYSARGLPGAQPVRDSGAK